MILLINKKRPQSIKVRFCESLYKNELGNNYPSLGGNYSGVTNPNENWRNKCVALPRCILMELKTSKTSATNP